jgi:hypothetical protein
MRQTVASPVDDFGQGLAPRRGSQYSHGVNRISGSVSANMYMKGLTHDRSSLSGMIRTATGVPLPLVALPQEG